MLAVIAQNRAKKQGKLDGVVVGKPMSSSAAPAAGTKTVPAEEVKGRGRKPRQFKYQAPAKDKELIQTVIDSLGSFGE